MIADGNTYRELDGVIQNIYNSKNNLLNAKEIMERSFEGQSFKSLSIVLDSICTELDGIVRNCN